MDVVLDYLWGPTALLLLATAARTLPSGRSLRFVQVGAASAATIALPSAVLRSSAIALLGSGLGSIGMEELMTSVAGVLGVATSAGLALDTRAEPLARVAETWNEPEAGRRLVYTMAG